MPVHNGQLDQQLREALKQEDTPAWGRVVLLALRDTHLALREHLEWHERRDRVWGAVWTPVLSALAVALTWAILSLL